MSPLVAVASAGALLGLAVLAGLLLRALDGRRREGGRLRFVAADAGHSRLGAQATLVQFSTELCTRCPQVRRMLREYADGRSGIAHVEVDLTHRPDLAARYRVLQTPTTFVVDATGAVRARFHGVPHRHALAEALAAF